MKPVSHSTFEAAVSVAGSALHWKSSLKRILRLSGVSEDVWSRYCELTKYQIVRNIWSDLDVRGAQGLQIQHNIISHLANLDAPDEKVPDKKAGQDSIDELRRLALQEHILVSPADLERDQRRSAAEASRSEVIGRDKKLAELKSLFGELQNSTDYQRRGYALETLMASLFRIDELEYTGSYRTETDQIDGAVVLDSFTYLLEAKWREGLIPQSEIDGFVGKVERRIEATRGLYVAINGFRNEVIDGYRRVRDNRIVFMDGADIAWILEGRMSFSEVMRGKVRAASVYGDPFVRAPDL